MGKRESYEAKTTELIQPVVEANGVELFDVDYEKKAATGICVSTLTKKAELLLMTARM